MDGHNHTYDEYNLCFECDKHKPNTAELEARIKTTLRLYNANLPGFIESALLGEDVLNMPFLDNGTIGDYLDAFEKSGE
ncbi:MAG: hypothetical protein GY774_20010 [Planctomycetes bacterium]|nr:hypothetical protein [Planctomycetota bacterium]